MKQSQLKYIIVILNIIGIIYTLINIINPEERKVISIIISLIIHFMVIFGILKDKIWIIYTSIILLTIEFIIFNYCVLFLKYKCYHILVWNFINILCTSIYLNHYLN